MSNTQTLLLATAGILVAVVVVLMVVLLGHDNTNQNEEAIKQSILQQPSTTYRCYEKNTNNFTVIDSDGGMFETETDVSMFVVDGKIVSNFGTCISVH